MVFSFKDIENEKVYENKVMFIFGKYNYFNKKVSDNIKKLCNDNSYRPTLNNVGLSDEFGLDDNDFSESTALDFDTFMDTVDSPSINGLWYCIVTLDTLSKKQKDKLMNYIKEPSPNGRLVVISEKWLDYRDLLKNRTLKASLASSYIELTFPHMPTLKKLMHREFKELNMPIDEKALSYFMIKMSSAYDKYPETINIIKEAHGSGKLTLQHLKVYMKGIEYFVVNDLMRELVRPLTSLDTSNRVTRKVLKIMATLSEEMGHKELLYKIRGVVEESIEFRKLINSGIIPIGIEYFYSDVMNDIKRIYGEKNKFEKMSESKFRNKAALASKTSLRDWVYMSLIISNALAYKGVNEEQCKMVLYELCVRSILSKSRLNNILKIDNALHKDLEALDRYKFKERKAGI